MLKQEFISVAGINLNITPGDNFFMLWNGTWYDVQKLQTIQAGVGSLFIFELFLKKKLLENILEEVSYSVHPKGSNRGKK